MNTRCNALGVIVTLFVFVPAFGQPVIDSPEEMLAARPAEMTPSRVLAGLRGYADSVVGALARLAEHPDALASAAEAVEAGREPALDAIDVDPEVREALNVLARSPGVLLLAASRPDELHLLHSLWSVAPDGVALRLEQLRGAYEEAARAAAHDWQRALENDPVALGEYRDLLTRYCQAAREADPAFACVRVSDRRYYYACLPDEALIVYTNEVRLPHSLRLVLARWWHEHAPQRVDARIERARVLGPAAVDPGDFIYDWPAAERTSMWRPLEPNAGDHALGLVPVILQPPADQPSTARLAWAVTEHVRLWSPPVPAVALQAAAGEVGPVPDEQEPAVVVEEPLPGPQTARHSRITHVDVPARERRTDLRPRYTGYYWGYPWAASYYCGPTYYYLRTSVFAPYDVCYPGDPYYLGGVYAPGHLGLRVYGSCRGGRIHYGGGRHYGRVSVSAAGRRDRRQPQVYVSTRSRDPLTRVYRTRTTRPALRQRSVYHRRSVGPVRPSPGTRAIRSGSRTISPGRRQALGSRNRAIRAGSRPAQSGPRVIRSAPRSSGRAIRPSSRTVRPRSGSAVRSRGGGVRRRCASPSFFDDARSRLAYHPGMARTLYLIDGHAQIYRAYYAPFGNLSAPSGEPTRATHVFCQMVLNLLRDRSPDYLAMVMDVSDETVFRKDIYPEYKAHRDPPPEDLPVQADRIVSILDAAGVPILRKERFEADDIMATLIRRFDEPDLHVYLVSRDKDLEQLLSDRVSLYDPMKDEVITPERLLETKGWRPAQAIDAQALTGDSVDNVPGVEGIGPKTAARLLQKYGSAQAVVEHADELTPKQRENVRAFAPRLAMTRQLVTLRDDVPIEFDLEQAHSECFNWPAVRSIFQELGFRRLLEKLPEERHEGTEARRHEGDVGTAVRTEMLERADYRIVNTPEKLDELAGALSGQPAFALDTETTSVNAIDAELVGLSFAWEAGRAYYVPVRSFYGQALPLELVRERLGPVLANPETLKIGQNLKYDLTVLRVAGMPVEGPLFDTMIAAFVLDPTRGSYKMDRLVLDLLGHRMIPITDLIGKGRDQLTMDRVPLEQVAEYAAEDADYTWRLKERFEPQLKGSDLKRLFYETEMPLVAVLTEMEYHGISLDADYLGEMSREMAARAAELTEQVHTLAGEPFNLDSPKQLGEILFDKLGFRVVRKTKTTRSTDAETLETLARETGDPLPALLLEYRELQKLRGTYVDALPADRSKRTGRIHTSYHQTGAVTGRLSSSEPNLQNIPVRTELGRQIRRAFVPRSTDELLIVADYSQIELRVLAHFCEDEELTHAFSEDRDIHAFVAAQVNGVPLKDVTKEMRARAKAVNFGIIYGQSAFGLAQTTGMSRTEAQRFIHEYFQRYPRIRKFIDQCIADAKREGFVRTIQGRRRPIPNIDSRNRAVRAQAERLAVNTVIQGSAADLIKLAMINLHRRIHEENLPLRMLLQVHDELVCEGPRQRAAELGQIIAEVMSGAMQLRVPLKVDVATGENWLEAK